MVRCLPTRRAQVETNLRQLGVASDPRSLRRATNSVFEHYGRYWYELFRLGDEPAAAIERDFDCDGYPLLVDALAEGRGAIVALPHLGNWDYAGTWLAQRGHRVVVVAERVEPPALFDWFVAQREALGMDVVVNGPEAFGVLSRALADGAVVCLVCDRDLAGAGVDVDFFGRTTTMPAGAALLALRTGAPLLPVGVYFRDERHHGARILPALDVSRRGTLREDLTRTTQTLADRFETLISAAPEQWLVMQPVWATSS